MGGGWWLWAASCTFEGPLEKPERLAAAWALVSGEPSFGWVRWVGAWPSWMPEKYWD